MSETFLNKAQLTGLTKDARRTEILRARGLTELDARLTTAEATIDPTAWTSLTLSAGWTGTFEYRKIGDMVWLRGLNLVAGTLGVTMATLPAGFRPPASVVLLSACDGGAPRFVGVVVSSTGAIRFDNYYGGGTVSNVYLGSLGFSTTA